MLTIFTKKNQKSRLQIILKIKNLVENKKLFFLCMNIIYNIQTSS